MVPRLSRMSGPAAGTLEMQITGIKANERSLCQNRARASPGEARTSHNSFSLSLSLSFFFSLSFQRLAGPSERREEETFFKTLKECNESSLVENTELISALGTASDWK